MCLNFPRIEYLVLVLLMASGQLTIERCQIARRLQIGGKRIVNDMGWCTISSK